MILTFFLELLSRTHQEWTETKEIEREKDLNHHIDELPLVNAIISPSWSSCRRSKDRLGANGGAPAQAQGGDVVGGQQPGGHPSLDLVQVGRREDVPYLG